MQTLEIQFRNSFANPPAADAGDHFVLDVLEERIALRELIARTVQERVRLADVARSKDQDTQQREYLSDAEIRERAKDGKVSLPQKPAESAGLNASTEIERALAGFQKRAFLVLVNGRQCEDLDEALDFAAQTKVTFLRLTPLVGG